jgi:uroporphyrinogen-III decarboxylase
VSNRIYWSLAVPPEVLCEKAGVSPYEYYHVPAARLEAHKRARAYFLRTFDYDVGTAVGNGLTSYWNATLFGAKIEFRGSSQGAVHERVLSTIEQVRDLVPPSPEDIPRLPRYREVYRQYQEMAELVKGTEFRAAFGAFSLQGPFTTATILRGTDLMADVVLSPKLVHELLEKIVQAQMNVMTFSEWEFGVVRRSCWMGDDYAGLISPAMYGEFCYPYMNRLFETYGAEGRTLHCETLKRGHHRYLNQMKIDHYDPGVNPDITIEDIREECPGLFFTANLHTVRDMVNKRPAEIRGQCEDFIRREAPGIITEITVNTPEENIHAFLETMRRHASQHAE